MPNRVQVHRQSVLAAGLRYHQILGLDAAVRYSQRIGTEGPAYDLTKGTVFPYWLYFRNPYFTLREGADASRTKNIAIDFKGKP